MWRLASMSPRSIRRASATSWAAVNSSTRPIERARPPGGLALQSGAAHCHADGVVVAVSGRRSARLDARLLRGREPAIGSDHRDPLLVEVRVQLLDLLLGDLDLLQARLQFREPDDPPLLRLRDQRLQFDQLGDRGLVAEEHDLINAQRSLSSSSVLPRERPIDGAVSLSLVTTATSPVIPQRRRPGTH